MADDLAISGPTNGLRHSLRLEAREHPHHEGKWGLCYRASGVWVNITFASKLDAEDAIRMLARSDLA